MSKFFQAGPCYPRLAPSLFIPHPTKSDIHEIIMHPLEEGKILLYAEISQPHMLVKKSYSPHIIPKTKGLEESLMLPLSSKNHP